MFMKIKKFNESNESDVNENLKGFKRKLSEFLNDYEIDKVLELIPKTVILPLFYKGDKAIIDGSEVIITDVGWKNSSYIYYYNGLSYYNNKQGEVYSYEDEFDH